SGVSPRRLHRLSDLAADAREVVVLDHDAVVKPHTMIRPAAAPNRVLLQQPPARGGLAGVENLGPTPRGRVYELTGEAGHTPQALEEVQGGALRGEDRTDRAVERGEHGPALDRGAVGELRREHQVRIDRLAN